MSFIKLSDLLVPSNITVVSVVHPSEMDGIYVNGGDNSVVLNNFLLNKITKKICNKCNNKGFITDDIEIISRSIGKINASHFTGDIHYNVKLKINICIPLIGTKIKAKVLGKNEAGALCIAEPFKIMISPLNEELGDLNEGDYIIVEVLRYKVEIDETYIKILGKFISVL